MISERSETCRSFNGFCMKICKFNMWCICCYYSVICADSSWLLGMYQIVTLRRNVRTAVAVSGRLRVDVRELKWIVPAGQRFFSSHERPDRLGGPHLSSYRKTTDVSPGVKQPGWLCLASPGQNPEVVLILWIMDMEFERYHITGYVAQFWVI